MLSEFKPLRVGLVGCGGMGIRHARAASGMRARGCAVVEIVAICDAEEGRREVVAGLIAKDGRRPAEYADPAALFADPNVEAVDIVLPTSLHHVMILEALAAGKHVLVEKPLALTVAACDLIVEAAGRTNLVVAVAENYRRIASNRAVAGLIREGAFGPLDAMYARNFASPEPPVKAGERPVAAPPWYRDRRSAGGYHVLEIGVHEADLQHFWFGPVRSVEARIGFFSRKRDNQAFPSEDLLTASFGFDGGFTSHIDFCSTIRGYETADRLLIGREAVVSSNAWHAWQGGEVRFEDGRREALDRMIATWIDQLAPEHRAQVLPHGAWIEDSEALATEPLTYGVGLAIHDFARAARSGTQPEINAEQARRAVATCCAMLESAELGTRVDVDDVLSGALRAGQAPLNQAIGLA